MIVGSVLVKLGFDVEKIVGGGGVGWKVGGVGVCEWWWGIVE